MEDMGKLNSNNALFRYYGFIFASCTLKYKANCQSNIDCIRPKPTFEMINEYFKLAE